MKKLILILLATVLTGSANAQSSVAIPVGTGAPVLSNIVSTTSCKVYDIAGFNTNITPVYIQVFNTNAVPANGSSPMFSIAAAAGANYFLTFGAQGCDFDACTVVVSSTPNTLTSTATNSSIVAIIKPTR